VAYYIRVLGTRDVPIGADELTSAVSAVGDFKLKFEGSEGWSAITISHTDDEEICIVERNPVREHELGGEELNEFLQEAAVARPRAAGEWLRTLLPRVQVIYAFQLLGGTDHANGWDGVHAVQTYIWNQVGGILQADREGFTNEDGDQITWDFSDRVAGLWNMASLKGDKWVAFRMELSDKKQREQFLDGEVPKGVEFV